MFRRRGYTYGNRFARTINVTRPNESNKISNYVRRRQIIFAVIDRKLKGRGRAWFFKRALVVPKNIIHPYRICIMYTEQNVRCIISSIKMLPITAASNERVSYKNKIALCINTRTGQRDKKNSLRVLSKISFFPSGTTRWTNKLFLIPINT